MTMTLNTATNAMKIDAYSWQNLRFGIRGEKSAVECCITQASSVTTGSRQGRFSCCFQHPTLWHPPASEVELPSSPATRKGED